MPFVFWNVSDVTVSDFKVIQPQLWSLNILNGTDMYFKDITCNATATKAPYGKNWVSRRQKKKIEREREKEVRKRESKHES